MVEQDGPSYDPGTAIMAWYRTDATYSHAADRSKRCDHVHGVVGNMPERNTSIAARSKVGQSDMGACQLGDSSGQRVTGVTTMPTPGTATR